ncbi:hypothetical protein [Coleofasciculus sp. G1-WW12-02]|jgi:hypothetical protein|uniref:hypothetical protein n=1 Tax=unclassified Coleofasciculus TaxID=2692782 RepID=UPI0032F82DB4
MSEPSSLSEKIDAGVKAAVAQAIERHRRLGQSISIWRDGKIVTLTADEIPPMQVETPIKKND